MFIYLTYPLRPPPPPPPPPPLPLDDFAESSAFEIGSNSDFKLKKNNEFMKKRCNADNNYLGPEGAKKIFNGTEL